MRRLRRREFTTLLGATALSVTRAVRTQGQTGSILPDDREEFQGYANKTSVEAGESISFHIRWAHPTTPVPSNYNLLIRRYPPLPSGDVQARIDAATLGEVIYRPYEIGTAAVAGCNWPALRPFKVPDDWPSGLYRAQVGIKDHEELPNSETMYFVVKPKQFNTQSKLVVYIPFTTLQAYNGWGSASFYLHEDRPDVAFSSRISFNRPIYKQPFWTGPHGYLRLFLQWLEMPDQPWPKDISYISTDDLHLSTAWRDHTKCFITTGHDEYWSAPMYDSVSQFIKGGGNVAFFGGNICYYNIELPEGPPRAMVLPGAVNGDSNTKDRALWGRKTNELIGLIITGNLGGVWNSQTRPTADYVVNSAASEHPFFDVVYKGLAVSAFGGPLDASHPLGYRAGGPGYEIDAPGDGTPQGFVVLAASDLSRGWDDARWYPNRPRLAVMGMYQYPNGGTVFSVGSISWTLYMRWRTISTITKNVIQYFLK